MNINRKQTTRSLNIPLAKPGLSNHSKKLRKDNEILLNKLKAIRLGTFGIRGWFWNYYKWL